MSVPLEGPGSLNHERQLASDQLKRHTFYCDECRTTPGYCGVGAVWSAAASMLSEMYERAKGMNDDGAQD